MQQNYYSSLIQGSTMTTRTNEVPHIPYDVRLKAIHLFVPNASKELEADLLALLDKRISNIHCVVLAKRIESIAAILSKHNVIVEGNRTVIINEFANVRVVS